MSLPRLTGAGPEDRRDGSKDLAVDDEPVAGLMVELDDQVAVLETQARDSLCGGSGGGRVGGEEGSCETAERTVDRRHLDLVGGNGVICNGSVWYLLNEKL